jgi:hypothetical protein
MLHFGAATWYGSINPGIIFDQEAKTKYLMQKAPQRLAVDVVNALNLGQSPVAVVGAPLVAGLKSDAVHLSWYNPAFYAEIEGSKSAEEVARVFSRRGIDYLILDKAAKSLIPTEYIIAATREIAVIETVSVRAVNTRVLFSRELLPSNDFTDGWSIHSVNARLADGGISASVDKPSTAVVEVTPGARYLFRATVQCLNAPALARLQVNWSRSDGNFIDTDIKVVLCDQKPVSHEMIIRAPKEAVRAVIYAAGHQPEAVRFLSINFKG